MAFSKIVAADDVTYELPSLVRANLRGNMNYVINGAFDIWQRGTSFTNVAFTYTADRWSAGRGGFDSGLTLSQQSSGIPEFRYAARVQRASGNTSTQNVRFGTTFESAMSIPLAGKKVTFSFYARAGANFSAAGNAINLFVRSGTGIDEGNIVPADNFPSGPANVIISTATLTTSWQRFTFTGTVAATARQLGLRFDYQPSGTAGTNDWFEIAGVQLEEGPVATPFRRNANSIQGELAACQRYYWRSTGVNGYTQHGLVYAYGTNQGTSMITLPVSMRTAPSSPPEFANLGLFQVALTAAVTSITIDNPATTNAPALTISTAGGLTTNTVYRLLNNNNVNGYIAFSAEL